MFLFTPKLNELHVFVVRHGESLGNVNRIMYKREAARLIELSDLGHTQAKLAGKFLATNYSLNNSNTLLFASSYKRACQTAEGINSSLNLKINIDDRIVEQNHGLFDGLSKQERLKKFPKEAEYFYQQKHFKNNFFTSTPMGESPLEMTIRFNCFWNDVQKYLEINPQITNVIIVAHGTTNLVIRKELMNYNVDWYENQKTPLNCSVMKFILHKNNSSPMDDGFIYTPNIT